MGSEHLKKAAARVRKLAEAQELGKQEGDYKGQKKKPLDVSLKEHIGKFVDKITADDLMEVAAVGAVAMLLVNTQAVVNRVKQNKYDVFGPLAVFIPMATLGPLLGAGQAVLGLEGPIDTWQEWVVIVGLSYLIVHNFGSIVQTTGNIAKSVSTLGLALLG